MCIRDSVRAVARQNGRRERAARNQFKLNGYAGIGSKAFVYNLFKHGGVISIARLARARFNPDYDRILRSVNMARSDIIVILGKGSYKSAHFVHLSLIHILRLNCL